MSEEKTETEEMNFDQLWTAAEVAKFLRVSRPHLYGMMKETDIPFRRIGKLVYFIPPEIKKWVSKNYNYTYEEKLIKGEKGDILQ